MLLDESLAHSGARLFRWRSYIPLTLLAVTIVLLQDFTYLFGSHGWDRGVEMAALAVSLLGLLIRMLTVGPIPSGTSGRNTKKQVADHLNTSGMYTLCRNPLYLGNFFIVLGTTLLPRLWWYPLLYALLFALFYERVILAEEKFLREKFGQAYRDWAANTPAFWPRLGGWRKWDAPFALRRVIRREYQSLGGIIGVFTLLEAVSEYWRTGSLTVDPLWQGLFIGALAIYLICLCLDKFTSVLKVRG